jgi:single-strand DNA-binding protein
VCSNYLKKGSLVFVEGSLKTRKYEKDGETKYATNINGRNLQMLDKKSDIEKNDAGTTSNDTNEFNAPATGGGDGLPF